jgi:hypothetical protein
VTRFLAVCLVLICCLPALAVQDGQVMYTGGTVPGLNSGTVGRLDMVSETALLFDYAGSRLAIPYAAIDSFEYSQEATRHLGALPEVFIGLVLQEQYRHFFRISYRDDNGAMQVAVFEVSKRMPRSLNAVLRGRAPTACTRSTTCAAKH